MPTEQPAEIILGGINGAGKTTASQALISEKLAVMSLVNADTIARGLNAFVPETVAFEAGRITLQRPQELRSNRSDFAFETTLAGRSHLSFLRDLRQDGYAIELYYFWLRSVEMAIDRVRIRVQAGGHNIPEATIRQRCHRSLQNFWMSCRHLADSWFLYDNSDAGLAMVAAGSRCEEFMVAGDPSWRLFREVVGNA